MMYYSLDLGGSNSRIMAGAEGTVKIKRIPSITQQIPENNRILKNIENPTEDFVIMRCSRPELENLRFTKGAASDAHTGKLLQIDNQDNKSDQVTTYINALHIIACKLLEEGLNNPADFRLGVCIPAAEFYEEEAVDKVKKGLSGYNAIYFPVLETTVEFNVAKKHIYVFPEGVVSLAPLRIGKSEVAMMLKKESGIVYDMGRRSGDVTPMREGKPVSKAARSFKEAGIVVESQVETALERQGLPSSATAVNSAIVNGAVSGSDVGYMVENAKQVLAGHALRGINSVLTLAEMNMKEARWIAVMGRPFKTEGKVGEPDYTGDLAKEMQAGLHKDIKVIRMDNEELANITGVHYSVGKIIEREEKLAAEAQVAADSN